jgi:hypothetical protein
MKKLAALATIAAVGVTPAAAGAKPREKAKVYKAAFQLVGADGSYTDKTFGKAQLVDGRRSDSLSVHVRNLGANAKYVFRLQSGKSACQAGAPGGTDVPGWRYRRGGMLTTNRKGVANSFARSRTFTADRALAYFVGVFSRTATGAPDQLVACARLTTGHHPKKPKHGHGDGHHGQGDSGHGNRGDHGHGHGN